MPLRSSVKGTQNQHELLRSASSVFTTTYDSLLITSLEATEIQRLEGKIAQYGSAVIGHHKSSYWLNAASFC